MADNDVRIKLSLEGADEVQSGLAGVGDAAVKSDSKLMGMLGSGLAGVGKGLLALSATAVAAGSALSAAVIKNYADYEQNLGGIETMFGAAGKTVEEYAASVGKSVSEVSGEYSKLMTSQTMMVDAANNAYKTAGLSANEYMSQVTGFSAALLQGLGGDTVKAAKIADIAMVDMSDNANKFGSNISDIQNAYQGFAKQNYTMLDNLKLGYGGTASEMARLVKDSGVMGDSFKGTAKEMNNVSYDKVIEAIHTVQTKMGVAGTTAKEASSTISGSAGMLKSSFDNLLTGLGNADADVAGLAENVITSFGSLIDNVAPVISTLGEHMTTLGPKIGGMATSLVGAVSSAIPGLIQAGSGLIMGLIQGVISTLPGLIPVVIPAILELIDSIIVNLPALIEAGIEVIGALVSGIIEALPTVIESAAYLITSLVEGIVTALPALIPAVIELLVTIVTAIIDNLPLILEAALNLIVALAQGLLQALPMLIEALPQIINGIITFLVQSIPMLVQAGISLLVALVQAMPTIVQAIVRALPQIINGIVNGLTQAIPQLISAGIQLLVAIVQNMPAIISGVVKAIPQIITAITNALREAIPKMDTMGLDLIKGLWNGISNATSWLLGKIKGFVGNVLGGIKGFFGIGSPSKVLRDEVGKWLPPGIGIGVEQNEDAALLPVKKLGVSVMKEFDSLKLGAQLKMTASLSPVSPLPRAKGWSSTGHTPTVVVSPAESSVNIGELSVHVPEGTDGVSFGRDFSSTLRRELRARGMVA